MDRVYERYRQQMAAGSEHWNRASYGGTEGGGGRGGVGGNEDERRRYSELTHRFQGGGGGGHLIGERGDFLAGGRGEGDNRRISSPSSASDARRSPPTYHASLSEQFYPKSEW